MNYSIDEMRVADAISRAAEEEKLSPLAAQEGSRLVEAWIPQWAELDAQWKIVSPEQPFFMWVDGATLLVGVRDLRAEDSNGPFIAEWKSVKEPQKNKDGSDNAWWNEDVWLEQLRTGPQLACYALEESQRTGQPRILVRAAVKSTPVRFWGNKIIQFSPERVAAVKATLIARGAAVRAARKSGQVPWAITGIHCTNKFRRLCAYYEDTCSKGIHPTLAPVGHFDMSDPGAKAIQASGADLNDPDVVIFSASSLDTSQQCLEAYRILVGGYFKKDAGFELQVGTALHAGIGEFYRQIMEAQNGNTSSN